MAGRERSKTRFGSAARDAQRGSDMKNTPRLNIAILLLAGALLTSCTTTGPMLPPVPVHPNGQVLWHIVHDQCVPDQREHGSPAPCAEVSLAAGEDHGFAVLKDRTGASQYLVMPTHRITGIEDPQILALGATNYFAPAWAARRLVEERLGTRLPREDASVAVNSIYGRSQDLLHLHVDCLRVDVRDALRQYGPRIGYKWSRRDTLTLAGQPYHVIRIDGDDIAGLDPFRRLAEGMVVPRGQMRAWTLVLAGATFDGGRPGFFLAAGRADPARGDNGSGEDLQDHDCTGRGVSSAAKAAR